MAFSETVYDNIKTPCTIEIAFVYCNETFIKLEVLILDRWQRMRMTSRSQVISLQGRREVEGCGDCV